MKSISFDEWYENLGDDVKEKTKGAELEGIAFILEDFDDMTYTICLKEGYTIEGDDDDTAIVGMHYPQQIINALNSIKLSQFYKDFPEELNK